MRGFASESKIMNSNDTNGERPTLKGININELAKIKAPLVPPKSQGELFTVVKQIEHDGVEMGVLEDGTPYLSESGLARMCGIDRKALNRISRQWNQEKNRPRGKIINAALKKSGYYNDNLFLRCMNGNSPINAYPEKVCIAVLEYYAFETDKPREQAITTFRVFAKKAFTDFIYSAVGYRPAQSTMESWRHFHDRVSLIDDKVPDGYFCVFREIASMIVPMIKNGLTLNEKTIPDISVGMAWSRYWKSKELGKIGDRIKFSNYFPDYYPQAKSNPQKVYAYPDAALPIFRAWLKQVYIPENLPKYLSGQTKKGAISRRVATAMIESFEPVNNLGN